MMWTSVEDHDYKKMHEEGFTNTVFATQPIDKGEEASSDIKERFIGTEKVYARCYLPAPLGKVDAANFWHELWIDGKFSSRTKFAEAPDPDWDQIQVWISEDEYQQQMSELGPGEHDIHIWVMKNVFKDTRPEVVESAGGEVRTVMKDIWIPTRLSSGKFKYVVQ